jgi:hypothetical protein
VKIAPIASSANCIIEGTACFGAPPDSNPASPAPVWCGAMAPSPWAYGAAGKAARHNPQGVGGPPIAPTPAIGNAALIAKARTASSSKPAIAAGVAPSWLGLAPPR